MRLKIDENLHDDVASLLRQAGHDVHTIHDEHLRGIDDPTLAVRCINERRALLTLDQDFADIRTYPPAKYFGLIVLRVGTQSNGHILRVIRSLIDLLDHNPLEAKLWIVTETGVRIRE